jgi:hypothetical protein
MAWLRSEFAIRFPFQFKRFVAFQVTDELFRREDGTEFDVTVLFDDVQPLTGFETEGFPDFLWDYDLVFG